MAEDPASGRGGEILVIPELTAYSIASIYSADRSTTATYVGPDGLIQTAGVNVPRFEAGELLVESAATNLALWSDDQTNWTGLDTTVTANSTVAPDGTMTADTVTFANVSAYRLTQHPAYSVAPGDKATFSIYVKSSIRVARFGGAVPSGTDAYSIEDAGGGWYRQTVTRTLASAPTFGMQYMIHAGMGLGVGSVAVWGAQGVVGGTVSSYIPTSSTVVTRAADLIYVSEGQSGYERVGGDLAALALDSFYGTANQSFYAGDTESFYEAGAYGQMAYVTKPISIVSALAGSIMTLEVQSQGADLKIEYRLAGPGSFYGQDGDSFYDADGIGLDPETGLPFATSAPFYGEPGGWMSWPGQLVAQNDAYQFRITIGVTATGVAANANCTIEFGTGTLTRVQFEPGTSLTPFERRGFSTELTLSQRYFEAGSGAIGGSGSAAVGAFQWVPFKVTKRAVPTLTYVSSQNVNVAVFDARSANFQGLEWYCEIAAAGGFIWRGNWTADCEI